MWNFIKQNSYLMFKMMVNQIGMTMFGLMLSMATINNDILMLLTSILSIGMYLFLLYTMNWEYGAKDKIRVDSNREKDMPLKGLWMSLGANIINLLLGIGVLIGGLNLTSIAACEPSWAYNIYYTCKLIGVFLQGMYSGILSLYAPYNVFAYLLIILPALAASTLGYYLGSRNIRILFFIKKNNTKAK